MKQKIISSLRSDLFKTSFLNGLANIVRIGTAVISNKVVAVYLGPAGVALLGQFYNMTAIAMSLATLGVNSGITKYTAEYFDDKVLRKSILSTGFLLTLIGSLATSLVMYFSRDYLAVYVLHDSAYSPIFTLLAITLFLFGINAYLISVLNGYKEFKKVIIVNASTSIVGLIITILLVISYGVKGAFVGYILSQTIICFITIFFVIKSKWFKLESFFSGIQQRSIVKLSKFSLMTMTSIFAAAFIQLQVRSYIITSISMQDAGFWQGVTKVSDIYLTFITSTLAIYYLPRFSEIKTATELKRELKVGYMYLIPLAIISSGFIYMFRFFIIRTLFEHSFAPMENLFFAQLLGSIFKIASWILAYIFIAKAMVRLYVITEVFFGVSFYVLTRVFVDHYGVIGATYSYAASYAMYLIVMVVLIRYTLEKKGHQSLFSSESNLVISEGDSSIT